MKFDSRCESISQVFADGENLTSVTLDAGDGIIPATVGWQVEQDGTATKSYAQNSTYGTLPIPQRAGYAFDGWSLLPNEYQQVEYIESTGTQYINTGFNARNLNSVSITLAPMEVGVDKVFIGNYSYTCFFELGQYASMFRGNLSDVSGEFGPIIEIGNVYTFQYIRNSKWRLDGVAFGQANYSSAMMNSDVFVFARNANGEHSNKLSAMQLYNLAIYDNNGLARNFIPCYQTSDNEIGLYDTVSNTFFTNQGSGTFLKGEDVNYVFETDDVNSQSHTLYAHWTAIIPEVGVFVDVVMPALFTLVTGLVSAFYIFQAKKHKRFQIVRK